jgi:hypothetical protein
MKEPIEHQLDDTTRPPITSTSDLNVEQREALAKVYGLLLALRRKKATMNESKRQASPDHAIDTAHLAALAVNRSDE